MANQMERAARKLWNLEDLLRQEMFRNLDIQDDLKRYCPSSSIRSVKHNSVLFLQGEPCSDVACILDGQVTLVRVDQDGNQFTTDLLFDGDFLGSRDGAEIEASPETAKAKGNVVLWRVPAGEFRNLLLQTPAFCLRLLQQVSERQRQAERKYDSVVFLRAEARLAATLRELSRQFRTRCEHGFGLHLRISQQELADLAGASRPVVSTLLNRLRDQGVLGYSREYICVRDIGVIEHLAGNKQD
jgi:CRP/FNR family cyclic AMP-dependent transcriptional regulator